MDEIKRDLQATDKIVNGCGGVENNYATIYVRTNENLKELFECFSVKDMDVLTVLASSDQYFTSYYLGAKSVDSFDINKLTEHYFYLRMWLLMYKEQLSPSNKEIKKNNEWIYNLLCMIKCQNEKEQESYNYWYSYVMNTLGFLGKNLFFLNKDKIKIPIDDISRLNDIIKDKELNFRCGDICGFFDVKKKYNIVIMSNILEYNANDKVRLIKCRDNLDKLLVCGGKVICTNLMDYDPSSLGRSIFEEKFDYSEFPVYYRGFPFYEKSSIGYCYTKR